MNSTSQTLIIAAQPPSCHTPDSYRGSAKEKDTEIERSEDSQTPLKDKREREQTGYSYPSTGSGRRFGARYYDSVPIAIGRG
jgi:hypothetical protein